MNLLNLFESLKTVSLQEFSDRLSSISTYAFRLELLQQFIVPEEVEAFDKYQSGQLTPPQTYGIEWRNLISDHKRKGVGFSRVRYVTPYITTYTKFEIAWGYTLNVSAGENIRVIQGGNIPEFQTDVPILKDFWLFDDTTCYLMEYDYLGKFLGVKELPLENIGPYKDLMHESIQISSPIEETSLWIKAE